MGFFSAPKRKQPVRRSRTSLSNKPPLESPLFSLDYETLVARALNQARLTLSAMNGVVNFTDSDWSVDQTNGLISFSNTSKGTCATGTVQIIGSYLPETRSWLWSWANQSVDSKLTKNALLVKKYGQGKKIAHLLNPSLSCDADAAWELGALACVLAGDQGVYRGDSNGTKMILNFGKLTIRKL